MYKISELSLSCPYCHKDNMGNMSLASIKRHQDTTEVRCVECHKLFGATLHYNPFFASFKLEENNKTDIELFI
jgi:hypothetical protein